MSSSASGSSPNVGGGGDVFGRPVLVNALVFLRKVVRERIPSFVPKISVSVRDGDAFCRMFRCCVYLGHSRRMCSLVWNVEGSSACGHAGESFYGILLCRRVLSDIVLAGRRVHGHF